MYSFSACMTSNIFQLKFGAHKFSLSLKEYNGAVLNRLKRISGLGPPISPSDHQGTQISSSLGCLICPSNLRHQRAPKLMFHCVIRGPISRLPHQVIAPHSFPIAL